nr:immunoglobulin heavy chain junction region [Mus musculus]
CARYAHFYFDYW